MCLLIVIVIFSHRIELSEAGIHTSITMSGMRWVGGVRKWQFLLIYNTIYAGLGGWVGLKSQKHADVILE